MSTVCHWNEGSPRQLAVKFINLCRVYLRRFLVSQNDNIAGKLEFGVLILEFKLFSSSKHISNKQIRKFRKVQKQSK